MEEIERIIEQLALDWNKTKHSEFKANDSNKQRSWQLSEPWQLIGKAITVGVNHWIVGFVAGLKLNQKPDTVIQFWLTSVEQLPEKPKSITSSSEDVSSNNFDTYNYQEFQSELATMGMVVVVREAVGTGWITILGLVQNEVTLVQILTKDSAQINIVPLNNSFLTILGPGKNAIEYAPISISIFDSNNQLITQNYWPSPKQLNKMRKTST